MAGENAVLPRDERAQALAIQRHVGARLETDERAAALADLLGALIGPAPDPRP